MLPADLEAAPLAIGEAPAGSVHPAILVGYIVASMQARDLLHSAGLKRSGERGFGLRVAHTLTRKDRYGRDAASEEIVPTALNTKHGPLTDIAGRKFTCGQR